MGSYYQKIKAKIGIVCDPVLYDSLVSAADFVYMPPSGWREHVQDVDMLLVVSTWCGLHDNEWFGLGVQGRPIRDELLAMIAEFRRRGIPVVFYSKEDPPNYQVFLDFAKACDFIFTTAAEVVPDYRRDCGHDRVEVLRFCIDPALANPVGCLDAPRRPGTLFTGSWLIKYPLRCRDLGELLAGADAAGRGLTIVDRNSAAAGNPGCRFPRRYRKCIRPAMPHADLPEFHKSFDWSLNVNTVTGSETMFAVRCYELLACGCPLISNFSLGMLHELPEIAIGDTADFVRDIICGTNAADLQLRRAAGIRRVLNGNTCHERVAQLVRAAGMSAELPRRRVAVVVDAVDDRLRADFEAQTYPHRRLLTPAEFDQVGETEFAYVSRWTVGHHYSPYFLQDLIDVFKYTDADFSTDVGAPYAYVDHAELGRCVCRCGMEPRRGFAVPPAAEVADYERMVARGHEITELPQRRAEDFLPPLWVRAHTCLYENGLRYTLRRILFGRQY